MWDWIAAAGKWLGDLFGGGGTIQVGRGNQAFTGSASGPGATSINAAGDVHYNPPAPPPPDPRAATFAEIESTMPELLTAIQKDLVKSPTTRDILALPSRGLTHHWPGSHFRYFADDLPGLTEKANLLADQRLLERHRSEFAFRMTPELANYLWKSRSMEG